MSNVPVMLVSVLTGIALYVGFYHLAMYAKHRYERVHLWFSLVCILVALYDYSAARLYSAQAFEQGLVAFRLQHIAIAGLLPAFVCFVCRLTHRAMTRTWYLALGASAGMVLLLFTTPLIVSTTPAVKHISWLNLTYYEARLGVGGQVFYAIVLFVLFNLFIRMVGYARERGLEARVLATTFVLFTLAAVNDICVVLELYTSVYLTEYGYFALILGMDYLLLSRFAALSRQLEQEVDSRTQEITDLNQQLSAANLELQGANRRLSEQFNSLQDLDRQKEEFLAMVSHDLRAPMQAVVSYSELLQAETAGPLMPKQHQYVDIILKQVEVQLHLIDQLLTMAQIQARRFPCEPQELDAVASVQQVLQAMAPMIQDQSLQTEVDLPADLPTAHGDPHCLERILSNLLVNAIKYTPPGGRLRISGRRADETTLELSVADTGVGISRADQEVIFERFRQARRGNRTGAGLGLAIARGLVELQGGEIRLSSEPGKGSTFTFTLPLSLPSPHPQIPPARCSGAGSI